MLLSIQKIEARGAIDSAHRVKQICGQVLRYAVSAGLVERDVTADLKGALSAIPRSHYAAITEPKQAGNLMRAIHAYSGHPYAVAALKLSHCCLCGQVNYGRRNGLKLISIRQSGAYPA